ALRGGARGVPPRALLLLPPHAHGLLGTAPRPRVGPGALPAGREPTAVAEPPVGADLHESLDVQRHLAAEVTLDPPPELLGDDVAQLPDLGVGELAGTRVGGHLRQRQDALGGGRPDAEDVGERDLDALVTRDVDAGDTSHGLSFLPLTLLVLGVL